MSGEVRGSAQLMVKVSEGDARDEAVVAEVLVLVREERPASLRPRRCRFPGRQILEEFVD